MEEWGGERGGGVAGSEDERSTTFKIFGASDEEERDAGGGLTQING